MSRDNKIVGAGLVPARRANARTASRKLNLERRRTSTTRHAARRAGTSPAPTVFTRIWRFRGIALKAAHHCLLAFSLLFAVFGQNKNDKPTPPNLHQWGAVTLFHGLPSDRVRAIAQDADGALWFGTDNGLAKYDGRRTQTVLIEGLNASRVLALQFEESGALWIGTDAGAARLANGQFQVIAETKEQTVTAILLPERGRALLATDNGVVYECRVVSVEDDANRASSSFNSRGEGGPTVREAFSVRALPETALTSADSERPGLLHLTSLAQGTNGVVYTGTRSRGVLALENGAVRELNSRPRAFFVEAVEQDADGALWIGARAKGADSGLYLARDVLRPSKIGNGIGTVNAIKRGAGDDLWVGTDGQGALLVRGGRIVERFTFAGTAGGLRSDQISAVFVDREGVVWFGTDRGVCRYDPRAARNERVSDDAESNFVRVLYRTKSGELLCGTNRGLFIYERDAGMWRAVEELGREAVHALAEDGRGQLLVGTARGLYAGSSAARESELPGETENNEAEQESGRRGENVRAVEIFQKQTYLAIYGRGVERLEGERRARVWPDAREANPQLYEVTALHADGDGRLWIGTARAGLFVYEGGRVSHAMGALADAQFGAVRAMAGRSDRALWLATERGLFIYAQDKLIAAAPGVDACDVMVDGATQDKRELPIAAWCATAGGLLRVVLDARIGPLVSRLDAEQGLASANAFALLRGDVEEQDAPESLLIGTGRGVVRYQPGREFPSLVPARVLSRRLHTPVEMHGGIDLGYPQNSLALDVAALSSRTYPEQFQYAFFLRDGAGKEIKRKLSRDSQFVMENLAPGRYTVEAVAFTKDLVASAPLAFAFTVGRAPFPWMTALLAVLLTLALVALVWGARQHWRIRRTTAELSAAHHELAGARLELANEAERERRRIARDLHDQTLADLRSLLLLTDQLPKAVTEGTNGHQPQAQLATVDPATFRAEIESVSNEIRRICEDLSPSALENVGLAAALEWALANAVAHLPEERKFKYQFSCQDELEEGVDFAPGVRMQIYRIAQEAINNVCRHAAATRVSLAVSLSQTGELRLTLEDDGRGFDARNHQAQQGRGLANIRARAKLIEAAVDWEKLPAPGGTRFTLHRPNSVIALS